MWSAHLATERLQRELNAPDLEVYWNTDLERYVVRQKFRVGAMNGVRDLCICQNADGSYRPLDRRLIHDMAARDKRLMGRVTAFDVYVKARDIQEARRESARQERQYRIKHDARRWAKAAEQLL